MSAALKKGMVTGLAAYQCREQRRDSASRDAHNRLRDECIDALMQVRDGLASRCGAGAISG